MALSPLSASTQARLTALCDRLNNKKQTFISEIVSVYASDASITPEHILVGLKGNTNLGLAYGAWYVHKSGISADLMNTTFIANNYDLIVVQDSPEKMAGELARVSAMVQAVKKATADAEAQQGLALTKALTSLDEELGSVAKTLLIPSEASDALVMTIKVKTEKLIADYNAVIKANQQEKATINA